MFDRYSHLLKVIRGEYNKLSSSQKNLILLILNIFLIGDKKFDDFKIGKCTTMMLAPYHPIMLEKIISEMNILKLAYLKLWMSY